MATKDGKKTGGRKKGSQNRLTASVKEAVLEVFQRIQGDNVYSHLFHWAEEHPTEFYKICAKMIPQQVQAEVNHVVTAEELPDNELAAIATGSSTGTTKQKDSKAQVH